MRFGRQFLDNLRARTSISSVVGAYVTLKHKGRGEFTGLCPFHGEKTPSFTVSDNKGFYHCFGCGVHGDVISFLTDYRGMPYVEAIKDLAQQAGMELPKEDRYSAEVEKKIEDSYEVLELAAKYFEANLESNAGMEARLYLKKRGLTPETIKKFRIGFALDEWESLKNHLKSKKVDEDMILANGLITTNDDGSKKYDRFRGRIIFPIFNSNGKIIAFGGRIMGGDGKDGGGPKYLNSPETDLFKKGYVLYGFNFAKDRAYKEQKIMAVEGYMDVIALHQAGFGYAVAPLGTALTENHLKIMWKVSKEPILCMDGDAAGQRASKKFAEEYVALLEPGYTIKFATVPSGNDPDEFIANNGTSSFQKLLDNAKPLSDTLWDVNYATAKLDTPEQKAAFSARMTELVNKIQNPSVKDFYKKEYADRIYKLSYTKSPKNASKSKKTELVQETRDTMNINPDGLEKIKERLILLVCGNPELLFFAEVEEVFNNIDLNNKLVENLAKNVINFSADIERSKASYSGFCEFLEDMNLRDQIDYLKTAFLGKNIAQGPVENYSADKPLFEWRYLLAGYNLAEAERTKNEYEKLLSKPDEDLEFLYEKQKEIMTRIFELEQKMKEERKNFEDISE